jgi:hypothetical protein
VDGDTSRFYTHSNAVAPNLFDVFGVPILAGRGFTAADAIPGSTAVIVDQTFAERLGAGCNVGAPHPILREE